MMPEGGEVGQIGYMPSSLPLALLQQQCFPAVELKVPEGHFLQD